MKKTLKKPHVMQQLEFESHVNDLFATIQCECPSETFKGTAIEHLMKHKIRITGYNDNYFFDVVNKEPRILDCKCGRKYQYQWTRDCVNVLQMED